MIFDWMCSWLKQKPFESRNIYLSLSCTHSYADPVNCQTISIVWAYECIGIKMATLWCCSIHFVCYERYFFTYCICLKKHQYIRRFTLIRIDSFIHTYFFSYFPSFIVALLRIIVVICSFVIWKVNRRRNKKEEEELRINNHWHCNNKTNLSGYFLINRCCCV